MRPLTKEQLKAIEASDWLYIKVLSPLNQNEEGYAQVLPYGGATQLVVRFNGCMLKLDYIEYSVTWFAWKTKELKEAKQYELAKSMTNVGTLYLVYERDYPGSPLKRLVFHSYEKPLAKEFINSHQDT